VEAKARKSGVAKTKESRKIGGRRKETRSEGKEEG